jgi:alkylhydroperoxidase family enzyme
MARLDYRNREDLAPADQDLLKRNINLHRILTHSPGMTRAFSTLGGYIRYGSKLDARLRELAILQVGWLARSPYEWSHHVKIGYDFGVTDADIVALIADTAGQVTGLSEVDRLVLLAAREAYVGPGVSEATFAALLRHFSTEHLTDLVVTISFYCAVVRVLASMQIDVEPDYMAYLEKYPFPAE